MNLSQASQTPPHQTDMPLDVLIVDDIPDNIRFLSSFLLEQGYQVRKAINGQMALRSVQSLAPDLILLDVNLPDMSGYDICQSLKEHPSTAAIPVIFLSASHESLDKIKAFRIGAADYITKPFHLEEVLVRIQTHLTIQQLQKELKGQNQQLQQAINDLKEAQANLVQQERMATLKKIVAGVSHEINNPLSFIAGNIKPTQEYINQLLTLIELYQQKETSTDPVIQDYLESIDLDFLTSDLTNILNSIENGAERIHAVVLALKLFTRLDEADIKSISLEESITANLALFQHRLTARPDGVTIAVKQDYGELPLITCHAEQLNQVLFNLLCNAIDAIEEKLNRGLYTLETPEVMIQAHMSDAEVVSICISDNGIGISEANKSCIFEPFFTTKAAGKGVGLGLAISQRIIEEMHEGYLTCHSTANEGSRFVIQLPIRTDD